MEKALMPALPVIKPDRILKELGELWTTMGKPESSDEQLHDGGVLRACAMTLISFVDDEEDAAALSETLAGLMKEHPSRAVVVRVKEGEDSLSARVFAQCWMPFGHRRQICCEQVEITASIDCLAEVAAIVGPLAVPDLPRVILLRSARVVRSGAIRKILPLGDKIVVDSARAGAPGFGELGGLLESGHIVGDLSWTRITEIRSLLAQILEARKTVAITVEYDGKEPGPETRYLQAWLESSLPDALVGLKGSGAPGSGKPRAVRVDADLIVTLANGGAEIERGDVHQWASLPAGSDEELLNAELSIVVHDRVLERVLNQITA
jgi:glucose-6-phosphate dehydrogenase assembly protein OpcA